MGRTQERTTKRPLEVAQRRVGAGDAATVEAGCGRWPGRGDPDLERGDLRAVGGRRDGQAIGGSRSILLGDLTGQLAGNGPAVAAV